jgi:hypothetical protein
MCIIKALVDCPKSFIEQAAKTEDKAESFFAIKQILLTRCHQGRHDILPNDTETNDTQQCDQYDSLQNGLLTVLQNAAAVFCTGILSVIPLECHFAKCRSAVSHLLNVLRQGFNLQTVTPLRVIMIRVSILSVI